MSFLSFFDLLSPSLVCRATHKGLEISTGMVNHPNQYYTESVGGGAPASNQASSVKRERVNVYGKDENEELMIEAAVAAEEEANAPNTT